MADECVADVQTCVIDLPVREIEDIILRKASESGSTPSSVDAEEWRSFFAVTSAMIHLRQQSLVNELRAHWRHTPDRSVRVVGLLASLWAGSEFRPLTEDKYKSALESSFEFHLPSGTDWSKFDQTALTEFYQSEVGQKFGLYPPEDGGIPHFAKHLLVLTRGTRVIHRQGWFLREKLDLLFGRLFEQFLRRLPAVIRPAQLSLNLGVSNESLSPDRKPAALDTADQGTSSALGGGEVLLCRRTLKGAVTEEGHWKSLLNFSTKISEPVWDEVIVLHKNRKLDVDDVEKEERPSDGPQQSPSSRGSSNGTPTGSRSQSPDGADSSSFELIQSTTTASASPEKQPAVAKRRRVAVTDYYDRSKKPARETETNEWCIQLFADLPFGDLEVALPHKKLGLLPLDALYFIVSFVMVGFFLFWSLEETLGTNDAGDSSAQALVGSEEGRSVFQWSLLLLIVWGLASRFIGIIINYMTYITYYERDIDHWLLRRRMSRGRALVSALATELEAQENKEVLIGYYCLLSASSATGLTADELKTAAQAFVLREGNLWIHFDVDDALTKLECMDLIEKSPSSSAFHQGDETVRYRLKGTLQEFLKKHPVDHLNLPSWK